jgi:hypothetical protein
MCSGPVPEVSQADSPLHWGVYNLKKMTSENVVLPEVEFDAFQRFCRDEGFGLCYYGPEIDGGQVGHYQSDSPAVIKVIKRRSSSVGVPYYVAEWQQAEWSTALPRLKDEFFKGGRPKMADGKADELDKADRKRKWVESWVFFRLAATSMSAGVLLVLVPSAGMVLPFVGFLLFLFSLAFLIAEWSRLYMAKWRNCRETILWLGERTTPVFIIVSVASVLLSGVKIMIFLDNGTGSGPLPVRTWELVFYSKAFIYWLIFFAITLAVSVFRAEMDIAKKHPLGQKLKRIVLLLVLTAGVIGVIKFALTDYITEVGYREVFILVSIFLLTFVGYYLLKDTQSANRDR